MGEVLINPITGDCLEFIETAEATQGRMSKFILTLQPFTRWAKSPRHFHPYQTETFEVLEGELHLTAGKEKYVLKPGDPMVTVPPFMLHSFWNAQDVPVSFRAEIFPPKNIERGLRLTYALSNAGKVNKRNIPYNPLHIVVLMHYVDSYFAFFPWRIQKALLWVGAKFAGLFGIR